MGKTVTKGKPCRKELNCEKIYIYEKVVTPRGLFASALGI